MRARTMLPLVRTSCPAMTSVSCNARMAALPSTSRCMRPLTRGAWRSVAVRAGVAALDVEIVCTDAVEHRRRVESREPDLSGHALPSWQDVVERDDHAWDRDRLVVDTAAAEVSASVRAIAGRLSAHA